MYVTRRRHFSLIELLVVITIISLLAGIVGTNVMKNMKRANIAATKAQIREFESGLDQFKIDNGKYPTSSMGLKALTKKPAGGDSNLESWTQIMDKIPEDPWDNDYNYLCPGTHNQEKFDVWSNGPDGQSGTEDDITNWTEEE